MKRIISVSAALLFLKTFAFAVSFHSEGKESIVPPGIYDELYDDGRANLAVVLDEFGMVGGVGDGVVINYEGADRLTEINGIRFYNKRSTLTDIGDVYAGITMKFTANSSGTLSGLFFRKASQAEGKSIFVDKIDVFTQNGSDSANAVGINNWASSTVGDIIGRSEGSFIRAVTNGGNQSYGIWNQVGSKIGSISNLKITASGGTSKTCAIMNDANGSTIGDISNVVLEAKDSVYAYGIYTKGTIGNLDNVKIETSTISVEAGVISDSYGIYSYGGVIGDVSNLTINMEVKRSFGISSDRIGDISGATINVNADTSYGITSYDIGNISDSSINVVGVNDARAVWIDGAESLKLELSNVKITAQLDDFGTCVGVYFSNLDNPGSDNSNLLILKNSTSISVSASSGWTYEYAIANEGGGTFTIKGDSTIHTFDGDIASKGNLIFDGHFKLLNCKIEAMSGMEITAGSSLEWTDKLVVEGDVTIDDSAILNIYLSSIGLDEYLALESDASITLSGEIDLNVYDQGGQALEGWEYELRPGEGGDQLWITAAVPEPATYAAIFGALALAFAVCRARK